jgi:predicted peroxiredoxin
MGENKHLQILITAGPEAQARATLGFAAGAAAAASGTPVSLFLVLNGIWWSRPSRQRDMAVAGFPPISELIEAFIAAGGTVEGCTACLENACELLRGYEGDVAMTPTGLTTVALRMNESNTVVF